MQFRYAERWLDDRVAQKAEKKEIVGEEAIIAYIDQSQVGVTPKIVPCRLAVITHAETLGNSICIVLEVTQFAFAADVDAYQQKIWKLDHENLPHWIEGKLVGKWFLELSEHFCEFRSTDDLKTWEKIVKQLVLSNDFKEKNVDVFCHVRGIYPLGARNTSVSFDKGGYHIRPEIEYELRIYQYYPNYKPEEPKKKWFKLAASQDDITFSSKSLIAIDSPYDLKFVRFTSIGGTRDQNALLFFRLIEDNPEEKFGKVEFELPLVIKGNLVLNTVQAVVIGVPIAAPAIIGMYAADKASLAAVVAALIFGCIAGAATVFRFKRRVMTQATKARK
ncbi:MAG: hypothetical protein ACE5H0_12230 [Bacteroidota bacterium]